MEERLVALEKIVRKQAEEIQELREFMAGQKVEQRYVKETVNEINKKLDMMLEFQNRWKGGAALLFALGGLMAWLADKVIGKIH